MKVLLLACAAFQHSGDGRVWGFAPKNMEILRTVSKSLSIDQTSRRSPLYAWQSQSPADNLLKMVEELSDDQFSPEVISKMQELEQTLISFLEERQAEEGYEPRPPGTPPPLHMLQNPDGTSQKVSLLQAEAALEKLRARLRYEEQVLRQAEEALQQSLQEEEILRRAEEALQKSREAAEKRKMAAIRQTEAAVVSTEQARRQSEAANYAWGQNQYNETNDGWWDQSQYSYNDTGSSDGSSDNYESYYGYDEQWSGRGVDTPRSTMPLDFWSAPDNSYTQPTDETHVPEGVPILYNWNQRDDGSIEGQVRNSDRYQDGASIATSPVELGAEGGSVIETSSGSRYYLENSKTLQMNGYNGSGNTYGWSQASPRTGNAPDGIPTIINWKVSDDGTISGLLYGYEGAEDGDYVETSTIVDGVIESGQVVTTQTGSQYFLSPDESEKAANTIAALEDLNQARRGSTITITKKLAAGRSRGQPRSTFSLMNIFGNRGKEQSRNILGETGPAGIPKLVEWSANDDGTITGVVSGSAKLNDGDMITTSPIVEGSPQQYATITTASGSAYFLA
mmetsp:Transcript_64669/g.185987  ORF Transcript_64669/g.185987 Transcript_64669/m.185987 type:complete len:565 (-) Transcript_64669:344-2038(-)